jgi:predicted amidohydrolase YtcJ
LTILTLCAFAGGADAFSGEKERMTVEAVYFNGRIHTMDAARPVVEAISVGGGRIVEAGSSRDLLARLAPGTRAIDLGGRAVIPGLTDAHAHFIGFAMLATRLDLVGTASLDEVLAEVAAKLPSVRKGDWILGRGWDQNDWPETRYPERSALDRIAPDNPVYLVRVCGHAAYVNSAALALADISRLTPDPAGGKILRDSRGEPTGILLDNAVELVSRRIPPLARDEKKKLMIAAARKCLAAGLVGVHEMGIDAGDVPLYEELYAAGDLPFRITGYLLSDDTAIAPFREAGPRAGRGDELFRVVGAKFYADGSLGARSAALLDDYTDDPGNRGILMQSPDSLYRLILPWREKGFQTAVHAIGDAAVREVLDVYERLGAAYPVSDARPRVEHSQVVSAEDVARFASLGVIPSMQFVHCTSDMSWAGERLGPGRVAGAYAWRSLVAAGSGIPGGSDFPVESIDPFLGIHAAVTRQDLGGEPPGGWHGEQRLTIEEAVGAFTMEAAYAAHAEKVAGSLAPGKLADFVVLSDDLFSIDPGEIPSIRVLATFLGGEMVYRSDAF